MTEEQQQDSSPENKPPSPESPGNPGIAEEPPSTPDSEVASAGVTVSETDAAPGRPRRGFFGEYGRVVLYALFIALVLKVFFIEAFGIPTGSMRGTLLVGDYLFVNKFVYGLRTPRSIPLTGIRIPHTKFLPGYASPERGDIVVFEFPGDRSTIEEPQVMNYVKRCVALPGDTVELAGKRLFVNGERQELPPTALTSSRVLGRGDFDIAIYPKGASFNRDWWGPMVVPFEDMEIELTLENIDLWRLFIEREGHTVRFTAEGDIQVDGNDANTYVVEHDYYFMLGDNRDGSEDSRYWGFVPDRNIIGEVMMVYWSWDSRIPFTHPIALFESIRWERIFHLVQ